jgi:hypothetical protein
MARAAGRVHKKGLCECRLFPQVGPVTPTYMVDRVYEADEDRDRACNHCPKEHSQPQWTRAVITSVYLTAILRDPVERARFHHRMESVNGIELMRTTFPVVLSRKGVN